MGVAPLLAALVLAVSPAQFVQSHASGGAFAEPGGTADAALTSWAVLGLAAAGQPRARVARVPPVAGDDARARSPTLRSSRSPSRRSARDPAALPIGYGVLRRRAAASVRRSTRRAGRCSRSGGRRNRRPRWLLAHQAKSGGFAWAIGGQPDSNDTAAALEALRVAGVRGVPLTRAAPFLLSFQNRDGGFELTHGRGSDAQSTAWAIQGLVAAGRRPPRTAFAYLARLRAPGRQLPLFREVRDDTRVGHVTGSRGARAEGVPDRAGTRRGGRPARSRAGG